MVWTTSARCVAFSLMLVAPVAAPGQETEDVRGSFQPVNSFDGTAVAGDVSIGREDGRLVIDLSAEGLPPGMHLAHIHGFATDDPATARCPDPGADANGDGFIDLIETEAAAGTTMIPFTDDVASLEIQSDTYPVAGPDGRLSWQASVDADALAEAVRSKFQTPLALGERVVFIHGAPEGADLPGTVQSLEGVPADVTLPIACAELDPAAQ